MVGELTRSGRGCSVGVVGGAFGRLWKDEEAPRVAGHRLRLHLTDLLDVSADSLTSPPGRVALKCMDTYQLGFVVRGKLAGV